MSPALTPELALEYLRELSADLRDGVVLDASGGRLAGEPALGRAARALLGGMGAASEAEGRAPSGLVLAARGRDLAIVLVCGPQAIPALARHDLRVALEALGAHLAPATEAATVPRALLEELLTAARRDPGE